MTIAEILPECYVDTNVVNTLLNSKNSANHCHSCNKVGDAMSKGKLVDQFAIGIIDNDKVQHSYVREFQLVVKLEHIELLKHHARSHYIVRVSPAMESFLLDIAAAESVSLADFGLPTELKALSKLTKDVKAKDAGNIKRLVRRLSDHPEMAAMKTILVYLNEKRYEADMYELKGTLEATASTTTERMNI